MGAGTTVGVAIGALVVAAFIGFALRDDSDVDMEDVKSTGKFFGGGDDKKTRK